VLRVLTRRLAQAIPVALGITLLTFLLAYVSPGDPLLAYAPIDARSDQDLARARAERGLDDPWFVQYVRWLQRVLQGDLGVSLVTQRPVTVEVVGAIRVTVALSVAALLLSTVVGVGLGMLAALNRNAWPDHLIAVVTFTTIGIPGFFLALLLISVFSVHLGWLPTSGTRSAVADAVGPWGWVDQARHALLPLLVLASDAAASLARYTRDHVVEVMDEAYVRTASAKGLSYRARNWRHAFPNALLPIVTVLGLRVPNVLAGSVIVESVFNWPGIGRLVVQSAIDKDIPVLLAVTLAFAIVTMIANLLTDLTYAAIDPRVAHPA
jgi:peptide/nickel transport system permease protein